MNSSIKSALKTLLSTFNYTNSHFFHFTTFLHRARRNSSTVKSNNNNNYSWLGHGRSYFKQNIISKVKACVGNLFKKNNNSNYRNRMSGHRRNHFKQNLMKNVKAYVDYLSKSWQSISGQDDQSSNKGPLRYRKPHNGSGRTSFTKGRQKKERRRYEDDHDYQAFFWWYMMYSSRKSENDNDDDDDFF